MEIKGRVYSYYRNWMMDEWQVRQSRWFQSRPAAVPKGASAARLPDRDDREDPSERQDAGV